MPHLPCGQHLAMELELPCEVTVNTSCIINTKRTYFSNFKGIFVFMIYYLHINNIDADSLVRILIPHHKSSTYSYLNKIQ